MRDEQFIRDWITKNEKLIEDFQNKRKKANLSQREKQSLDGLIFMHTHDNSLLKTIIEE